MPYAERGSAIHHRSSKHIIRTNCCVRIFRRERPIPGWGGYEMLARQAFLINARQRCIQHCGPKIGVRWRPRGGAVHACVRSATLHAVSGSTSNRSIAVPPHPHPIPPNHTEPQRYNQFSKLVSDYSAPCEYVVNSRVLSQHAAFGLDEHFMSMALEEARQVAVPSCLRAHSAQGNIPDPSDLAGRRGRRSASGCRHGRRRRGNCKSAQCCRGMRSADGARRDVVHSGSGQRQRLLATARSDAVCDARAVSDVCRRRTPGSHWHSRVWSSKPASW